MQFRRCLIALGLAATLCTPFFATPALADEGDATQPPPAATQQHRHHGRFRQALRQIGLSEQQKQEIRQIHQQNKGQHNGKAVRQQILAVLTPEQRQQLQQMLHAGRHRQPAPQPPTPPPGT